MVTELRNIQLLLHLCMFEWLIASLVGWLEIVGTDYRSTVLDCIDRSGW